MAAPTLFAEGAIAVATTGTAAAPTIPTHAANDILVVTIAAWRPNTTAGTDLLPAVTNWTKLTSQTEGSPINCELAVYWRRATAAGTTFSVTQPAAWDTGTDGALASRAYVIRGCVTTGDPWDAVAIATRQSTANLSMPAVTVSGAERMIVQFLVANDDNGVGAGPGGSWVAGTRVSSTTGTDAEFQTYRLDDVSASSSATASTVLARTAGFYTFFGASFKTSATAPAAVADLFGSPRDASVSLDWTAPANNGSAITDYVVEYLPNGGSWTSFSDGTSTTSAVLVTGLTNGTSYQFRVAAVNAHGTASWSNIAGSYTPTAFTATTWENNFETGLGDGVQITLANSNDNGAGRAFDAIQASGTREFDTGIVLHGTQSLRLSTPVSSDIPYLQWSTTWPDSYEAYSRMYFRVNNNTPTSNFAILVHESSDDSYVLMDIRLSTTGYLQFRTASQTLRYTTVTQIPVNTWCRLEAGIVCNTSLTATCEMRLFVGDNVEGSTPDDSYVDITRTNGDGVVGSFIFGFTSTSNTANLDMNIDSVAFTNVGWLGSIIIPPVLKRHNGSTWVPAVVKHGSGWPTVSFGNLV